MLSIFIMVVLASILMPFVLLAIIAMAFLLLLLWLLLFSLLWELGVWLFTK